MDEIEDLPIVHEQPPASIEVSERQISPVLSDQQYRQLKNWGAYATPEMGPNEIEPNVVYKDRKQVKFLLLPNAVSTPTWLKAHVAAEDSHMNKGTRSADGQKYGRKLTLGWIKLRYPGWHNMRTAPTMDQPELLAAFYPLILEMDRLIERAVPDYYKFASRCAFKALRPDVRDPETGFPVDEDNIESRVRKEHDRRIVRSLDPWNLTYTIRGTVFSTAEFNKNIVFKAHEDGHNVEGTCVCITTLGHYAGGRLVFPRYGYSAELKPRDVLLCDNNQELHGNLGPIVGNRFSVVAFLHDSVCGRTG